MSFHKLLKSILDSCYFTTNQRILSFFLCCKLGGDEIYSTEEGKGTKHRQHLSNSPGKHEESKTSVKYSKLKSDKLWKLSKQRVNVRILARSS